MAVTPLKIKPCAVRHKRSDIMTLKHIDEYRDAEISRNLIEKIMLRLSAKEKMILTLSEVEGMSVREIAALMGMSAVNVKIVKFRARKRALKALNDLTQKDGSLKEGAL